MNRVEILRMLGILKSAYPNFYKDISKSEAENIVELYEMMFKDESKEVVFTALKDIISTSEYPPTIATIKNKIYELKNPYELDNNELWISLLKAISNSSYHSEEEFSKLPNEVKLFVRSPEQLREMAVMDSDVINSVTKGQFMKQIEVIKQRVKEDNISGKNLLGEKEVFKLEDVK